MPDASTLEDMSPKRLKVVERAKREPEGRFHSLAHLIDVSALMRADKRMRNDAAVGVDGVTKEQYGQDLAGNLRDLHERLVSKRYRHQPIRRVHIPKEGARHGRLGFLRTRTSWSRTPYAKCWRRYTSRTFWNARTASGPVAVPMTPFEPSTVLRIRVR